MLFNSLTYGFFLLTVWLFHWSLPARWRLPILCVASAVFYCSWRWEYGVLLYLCIAANFYLSHIVAKRVGVLWLTVSFNLGLLGYYKYLGFFAQTLDSAFNLFNGGHIDVPQILLPLGISFFTFHAMSYVIDVYRGDRQPEPSLLKFILYETFWPHLIAGPILRSHEIIPQFGKLRILCYEDMSYGARRILEGLFKKVVLADSLAPYVDEGFKVSGSLNNSALDTWALAFGFGLQIYFDFSGYSDIAIGSARLFGYRFPENFTFPYLASSPKEFWNRWHITLSSWIRDYLYIPLQNIARRTSTAGGGINIDTPLEVDYSKRNLALFGTWGLMGLWHGANWTFVIWGLWHAVSILVYRLWNSFLNRMGFSCLEDTRDRIATLTGFVLTTTWVMLGWLFFRSADLSQAWSMLATIADPDAYRGHNLHPNFHLLTSVIMISMYGCYLVQQVSVRPARFTVFAKNRWIAEGFTYCAMAVLIIAFLKRGTTFIYFQF